MERNALMFGLRLLWGKISGKGYPFLVQLNITNRCNARCAYCYGTYYRRPAEEMPLDRLKQIIDGLHAAGVFRINLVGGEPLLRSDVGQVISYVRGKGIHCAMTTNGSLVPHRIDSLRALNTLCFSIDGRPENNDRNRGEGSFERAMEGLYACRRRGIPVQLSSVITKYTAEDVAYMVALAEEFNCRVGFSVLIGQRLEGTIGGSSLSPSQGQIRSALGRILELKRQGRAVLFSSRSYQHALRWPDLSREIHFGEMSEGPSAISCQAGRYFCLVDYNGDVYPCPQLVGVFKPANIFEDGFAPALRHSARHGCKACAIPCSNDFSLFFNLDPGVLLEHLLTYGKK